MNQAQTLQVIITLLFVLGLLLSLAWIARRSNFMRRHTKQANLVILGSQSLGPKCSVTVVKVDNTKLVLGVTPQQITLLHTFPMPDNNPQDFAQTLNETIASS